MIGIIIRFQVVESITSTVQKEGWVKDSIIVGTNFNCAVTAYLVRDKDNKAYIVHPEHITEIL